MHSFSWITSRRAQKGALVSFFCFVFLPLLTHPGAVAQQVVLPTAKAFDGGAMNQPKNDVTLTGTVQQLMEKATAGVPLAVRDEVLTVLPATLGEAALERRLKSAEAAAILKLGRHLPKVRRVLKEP